MAAAATQRHSTLYIEYNNAAPPQRSLMRMYDMRMYDTRMYDTDVRHADVQQLCVSCALSRAEGSAWLENVTLTRPDGCCCICL